MKRTLHIKIESGETTCASQPGQFCPWMRTRRLGQEYICGLFPDGVLTENADGWLERRPECLAHEARPTRTTNRCWACGHVGADVRLGANGCPQCKPGKVEGVEVVRGE